NRDLLLARAEFGHELLDLDTLLLQRDDNVINNPSRSIEPNATVAQTAVERLIASGGHTGEIKLVLHCCLHDDPHLLGSSDHTLEEGTWTGCPRLVVQSDHIAEHHAATGSVWENHKGAGIRHQAKFPDWPHALDGSQCVDARKRLHGERLANALGHTTRQAIDV